MPWIALALVAADRLIKTWASACLTDGAVTGIPGVFRFRLAHNTGASFSMFSGNAAALAWITGIALACLTAFLLTKGRALNRMTRLGLWTMLAGGAGNLIDRAIQGYVVDYIELTFMRFAVFNLADICVCAGAFLACAGLFFPAKEGNK